MQAQAFRHKRRQWVVATKADNRPPAQLNGASRPRASSLQVYEAARRAAVLLSDVDLFFFVNVAEKIDQSADKEHDGTPDGPPHITRVGPGVRHKEIELPDSKRQRH